MQIGNNKFEQIGKTRTEKRVTVMEPKSSARKTRYTKRGSFIRLNLPSSGRKHSALGDMMNNMIDKQFKGDSESDNDDQPEVSLTRCWVGLRTRANKMIQVKARAFSRRWND